MDFTASYPTLNHCLNCYWVNVDHRHQTTSRALDKMKFHRIVECNVIWEYSIMSSRLSVSSTEQLWQDHHHDECDVSFIWKSQQFYINYWLLLVLHHCILFFAWSTESRTLNYGWQSVPVSSWVPFSQPSFPLRTPFLHSSSPAAALLPHLLGLITPYYPSPSLIGPLADLPLSRIIFSPISVS